jgi:hypothetical protein
MAKITGPLLSLNAVGTFASSITFSQRQGGQQARHQRAQKDYENANRQVIRNAFRYGLILWASLPAAEKEYWTEAESKGYADV